MPTVATPQQVINGKQYDYSSIAILIDNVPHAGVKSIDYSHSLDPGEGRGTRAQIVLRSRGKYSADASLEVYKLEYQQIIQALGPGYMERAFDIMVSYAETGLPTVTDVVKSCRIKKDADSNNDDGGLATVKVDLHVMQVIRNGLIPVEPTKFLL